MKKNKGFTLIELLVVIAIIGILSAIVLVSLAGARDRAKDARIQADMYQIRTIGESIFISDGDYDNVIASAVNTDINILAADMDLQNGTGKAAVAINRSAASSAGSYCAEVQLNSGKWCCADSTLASKCTYDTDPSCSTTDFTCD